MSFGGGQVEPATGDFVFGVSEGYLIEGGKVTAPVRGATLVGNGIEALRRDRRHRRRPRDRERLLRQGRAVGAGRRRPAARAHQGADRGRDGVNLEEVARRAVEAAADAGATDAEAWVEEATSRRIRVYEGEVESLSDAGGRGVGVRAFVDGRSGYAYGTDLSDAGIAEVAGAARAAAEAADPDEYGGAARRVRRHAGRGARVAGAARVVDRAQGRAGAGGGARRARPARA